jgi:hypothetical protein
MYIFEESDSGIIPMNHSNKDGKPYAESEEGRPRLSGSGQLTGSSRGSVPSCAAYLRCVSGTSILQRAS